MSHRKINGANVHTLPAFTVNELEDLRCILGRYLCDSFGIYCAAKNPYETIRFIAEQIDKSLKC